MNLPPYVFNEDHVVKIRSELSVTVLEKKIQKVTQKKVNQIINRYLNFYLKRRILYSVSPMSKTVVERARGMKNDS